MLEAVIVEPKLPAQSSVIWLHGLGANGHDFVDTLPMLNLPSNHTIRFIFPHAPMQPVTINGGIVMPAWYDILALDLEVIPDEAGIKQSEQALRQLITHQIANGISSHKIILMGFSQGGAIALYTALRFPQPLAGVAGLSTYLPLHEKLLKERQTANANLPILLAHGFMDPVVSYWHGQKSSACLKTAGYNVQWHAYPIGHTVCLPELTELGHWLQDLLAG